MAAEVPETRIEELLQHDAWLRRMVADLVEPDLVDDVVQETFLAAWMKGKELRNLPGFLRRVGKNLAIRHRRTEVRRRQREQHNAPNEQVPSTAAMLERLQAHRQLTEAVGKLEEPYRTTVLLRYFEDLSPKQIAERLGVPASTVRTRLERGLEQLHGRLGGRDLRALAALFLWPGAEMTASATAATTAAAKSAKSASTVAATLFSGAVFMTLYSKAILLGSVGVALLGFGLWQSGVFAWDHEPADLPAGPPLVASQGKGEPSVPDDKTQEKRAVVAAGKNAVDAASLRGRVLDTLGMPLRNVDVTLFGFSGQAISADQYMRSLPRTGGVELATNKTDGQGRFRFPASVLQDGVDTLETRLGNDLVPLRFHVPAPSDWMHREAIVVASRGMTLEGQVVDRDNMPIHDAILIPRVDGLRGFDEPLDHTESQSLGETRSDKSGSFRLTGVPNTPELELHVAAPKGYRSRVISAVQSGGRLRIVLAKKRPSRSMLLTGRVVDRGQRFVEDAIVGIGGRTTRTDRDGRFRLRVRTLNERSRLFVGRKGHQTRLFPEVLAKLRREERLEGALLTLGDACKELRGRVVDQDGKPVAKLPIVLEDATFLEFVTSAEDYARGEPGKVDSALSANGSPAKTDAVTDADGRFVVRGLSDRPYVIRAWIPKSLVNVTTGPLQPGSAEHEVVLRTNAVHATLSGVVKTTDGKALAGANVYVQFKTFDNGSMTMWAVGSGTKTDDQGAFVLKDVPISGVRIAVWNRDIVDLAHELREADDVTKLTLVPYRRCHFRLELTLENGADELRVLDGKGQELKLWRSQGGMSMTGEKWTVKSGKAPTLAVSEAAATLVLSKSGKELRRIPIRLEPGQVIVVR